jgi:hypothetical protein
MNITTPQQFSELLNKISVSKSIVAPSKNLQPEDNWGLVGNPSVYLDQLPQPYRFINECLDNLIIKPVFNRITVIEEMRKTPEYEGNIKEVMATASVDINGVTV